MIIRAKIIACDLFIIFNFAQIIKNARCEIYLCT